MFITQEAFMAHVLALLRRRAALNLVMMGYSESEIKGCLEVVEVRYCTLGFTLWSTAGNEVLARVSIDP